VLFKIKNLYLLKQLLFSLSNFIFYFKHHLFMTQTRALSPSEQLLEMFWGLGISRVIAVAAEFFIADYLKDGPKSIEYLAEKIKVHPRSLYRILRACASVGIFSEDSEKRFSLTPLAEPLLSDAPNSLRAYAQVHGTDWQFQTWADLSYSLQTGKPAFEKVFGMNAFDYFWSHPKAMQEFNDSMTSSSAFSGEAVLNGYDFSGISKLVDVGGGQGLLLARILQKYPQMKGVVYDVPPVVEGAKEIMKQHDVADRGEIVGGDFFESVPEGGDAYIMKFVIHDWNDEQCITILKNCRKAMQPQGKVLIVEMVLPEGNAPSVGKWMDLQMLLYASGCERTVAEYRTLLDKAGFELTKIIPAPASPFSIVEGVCK
jgi:hypothetical protein